MTKIFKMHLGEGGIDEPRAINEGVLLMGWSQEDMTGYSLDDIKSVFRRDWPHESTRAVGRIAGMTHTFWNVVSVGDYVLTKWKTREGIGVGKIIGPCRKDEISGEDLRPVEWLSLDIDKAALGEDLQSQLRPPMTISEVRVADGIARIEQIVATGEDPGPNRYSVEGTMVTRDELPGRFDLMLPVLHALNDLGGEAWRQDLFATLADNLDLPQSMREILHGDGPQTEFDYQAAWTLSYLRAIDALDRMEPRYWKITDTGRWYLQNSTNEELVERHRKLDRKLDDGKYSVDDIVQDGCFVEQQRISNILERLRSKKNLILQGPPGTGKTWLAKRLAWALVGWKDASHVRAVQFHPNLSYEDFVRGWRPSSDGKLELMDGLFLEIVAAARGDAEGAYVLVIEEINRGNPAQILGEMLTLLEADKRNPDNALELTYKREGEQGIHLPPNLYLVGTMNIADRSLALVDLALRRRFAFVDLMPEIDKRWQTWVKKQCGFDDSVLSDIQERMANLNQTIESDSKLGRQFQIGHSYVTPPPGIETDPSTWYRDVVKSEIGPLLDEYWFDEPSKAQGEREKLLEGLDWL